LRRNTDPLRANATTLTEAWVVMGARDIRHHRNKVTRTKIRLNTELSLCMSL